jgi:hypothetical protein
MNENPFERKHFRFPAYSDNEPVIIRDPSEEREIFPGNNFLTKNSQESVVTDTRRGVNQFDNTQLQEDEGFHIGNSTFHATVEKKDTSVIEEPKKESIYKRPTNLKRTTETPVYQKKVLRPDLSPPVHKQSQTSSRMTSNITKNPDEHFGRREEELDRRLRENWTTQQEYTGGLNRFKSRSNVFEKPQVRVVTEQEFTDDDLLASMKKDEGTYLLFDEEMVADSAAEEAETKPTVWREKAPRVIATQNKPVITSANKRVISKPVFEHRKQERPVYQGTPVMTIETTPKNVEDEKATEIKHKREKLPTGLDELMADENIDGVNLDHLFEKGQ